MEPEIIIGIAAVFVSGGAIGSLATLATGWVFKQMRGERAAGTQTLADPEVELLRNDVAEMSHRLRQLDYRLEFTEQLIGGSNPELDGRPVQPGAIPAPLAEGGDVIPSAPAEEGGDEPATAESDGE